MIETLGSLVDFGSSCSRCGGLSASSLWLITNGQTERVNRLLEEYLHHYVIAAQMNRLELLEPTWLSYNLHRSSPTRMSSFEVSIGFQPHTPLDVLVFKQPILNVSLVVYKFLNTRQDLLMKPGTTLRRQVDA